MSSPLETAQSLANALDQSDYERASALFHPGCVYDLGEKRITGRDEIVASYRAADDWGRATLDTVIFESTTTSLDDGRFAVDYLDRLCHQGQQHEHRCRQILTLDNAQIVHIEHVDLPGEPEALRAFFERVGVER